MYNGVVRKFRREDLEEIRQIYSQWYRPEEVEEFLKKLNRALDDVQWMEELDFNCIVAENDLGIAGVLIFRKPHKKLFQFIQSVNAIELYSIFVREKQQGAGRTLVERMINLARDKRYNEIIVASFDRWDDSWEFYDKMGFERVGEINESAGETLQIWHRDLL